MVKTMNLGVLLKRVLFFVLAWVSFSMANTVYPNLYGAIGTPIYLAADGYRALVDLDYFGASKEAMQNYIEASDGLKIEGFRLDGNGDREAHKTYITALRKLEKHRDKIDRQVAHAIRTLKARNLNAELSLLEKNPYPLIREISKRYIKGETAGETKHPEVVEKDSDALHRSLASLTEELQHSRDNNAENIACLNDITAINYWMLKVDPLKLEREWCKAADVCQQIIDFEHAARKNCGEENVRYLEWRDASAPYRTSMKQMFEEACRR